jgi:hypothetical protein
MNTEIVGIFDASFNHILQGVNIIKASVNESAKIFDHPIETGSTVNDHKIINPVEIEFSCVLKGAQYKNVYQEIKQIFQSSQLLTIQTRTGSYANMALEKMPHEEEGGMASSIMIGLQFKEAFLVKAQFGVFALSDVKSPSQSSTVGRGEQLPGTPSASSSDQGSFLYRQFIK